MAETTVRLMYLVPINVAVHQVDGELAVGTEWARSLELLRDSFDGRFGDVVVAAPLAPGGSAPLRAERELPGVRLVRGYSQTGPRAFWQSQIRDWRRTLEPLIARASVVHSSVGYALAPAPYLAHRMAVKAGNSTVFVLDMDKAAAVRDAARGKPPRMRARATAHATLAERLARSGVGTASLALLKAGDAFTRYRRYAAEPLRIIDTSYRSDEALRPHLLEQRLGGRQGPLRLVYLGQLIRRKRVDRAINLLGAAIVSGIDARLTVIGDGPERAALEREAEGAPVDFLGHRPYGPKFIQELADFDVQVLPSEIQDTPRSVFDGFAAGLPLIGSPTTYVRERAAESRAVALIDWSNPVAAVRDVAARLGVMSRSALRYGHDNSADVWYRRRADATIAAVSKRA